MKKFGFLTLMVLMVAGLVACGDKKGENSEGAEGAGASTENVAPANKTTPPTDAASNANAEPASTRPLTSVAFGEDSHNFGEIPEGDKVSHVFKFKNSGTNPLKIQNVKASCGCTTPDWTKDELAPGAEGFVTVEFDSKGKNGVQKKSVTVTFENTDPKNKILNFTGEVVPGG